MYGAVFWQMDNLRHIGDLSITIYNHTIVSESQHKISSPVGLRLGIRGGKGQPTTGHKNRVNITNTKASFFILPSCVVVFVVSSLLLVCIGNLVVWKDNIHNQEP